MCLVEKQQIPISYSLVQIQINLDIIYQCTINDDKQHTVSVNAGLLSISIIDILNNKTKVPQIVW